MENGELRIIVGTPILQRLDETFVDDIGASEIETLRQVLDAAIISFQGNLRLGGCTILIIKRVLVAYQRLAACIDVGACEVTLATLFVVDPRSCPSY